MPNFLCRLHGGLSTGPKTPEGIERIRSANVLHGNYSAAAERTRREVRDFIRASRAMLVDLLV
jgi:hypothetical protein